MTSSKQTPEGLPTLGQFGVRPLRQGRLLVIDTRAALDNRSHFTQRAWARDARSRRLPFRSINDERVVRRCATGELLHSAFRRYGTRVEVVIATPAAPDMTAPRAVLVAIRLLMLGMLSLPALQEAAVEQQPIETFTWLEISGPNTRLMLTTALINDLLTHGEVLQALDRAVVFADREITLRASRSS